MSSRQSFFLLDGHAIAYRAFFGMQNRRFQTRQGLPTGAVFGFTRILFDLIRTYRPERLAVCFDTKDPTHRHEAYDSYKGHRKPPPDDLILQFPYMEKMVRALGIPVHILSGYEADDLIGTLAVKAAAQDVDVRIVTGDRDLFQLINERIHILLPARDGGKLDAFDAQKVHEKYGYRPDQVVDYKALAGDSSDNIPGVRGIGDKSAIKLLESFDTLQNMYAQLEDVPSKWQKKLETGRDDAFLSQKLATIMTDAPVDYDPEASKLAEPQMEELLALLKELEFTKIQQELPQVLGHFASSELEIDALEEMNETLQLRPEVTIPASTEEVEALARQLQAQPFAFDSETTGLNALNTSLVGLSFAFQKDDKAEAYYLPVGHSLITELDRVLDLNATLAILKPVFEDPKVKKIAHNAKFDVNVLSQYGIRVRGVEDDTMILDYLLNPDSRHGLKDMCQSYLNLEMQPITDLIGKGRKQITMDQVSIDDAAVYAAADAVATLQLQQHLKPQLKEQQLEKLYTEIEMPLMSLLAQMEQSGVRLDVDFLSQLSDSLDQQLRGIEADVIEAAGESFNLNSPQQLSKILFENFQLPTKGVKKNKTGAYATDVKTLEKLRPFHPAIDKILEQRQLAKLKSTYVDALPQLINPKTERLHTTYNQTVASTGRLSSSDPNLQNIPIRTDLGRQMRKAFIARNSENCLVSFDYSQIELRLLAHFSEDERFVTAFQEERDIHAQTAVEIFNLGSLDEVTSEMRRIAKTTNFGIVYGQTTYGLARTLNIPNHEASEMIQRFKERYAGIEAYMQNTLDFAREQGYVETLFHRRRPVEDIHHPNRNIREFNERVAINSPLQGSASDLIKIAMLRIQAWLNESQLPVEMLLQVHDELVFEMPRELQAEASAQIQELMEQVHPLKVPLVVDVHSGQNWMEAK